MHSPSPPPRSAAKSTAKLAIRDITIFSMLTAIMVSSQYLMQAIPNVHLQGLFIAAITLTYGVRALIPIYLYVFLLGGVWWSFAPWWVPYLYVWLPLWGMFMLVRVFRLPQRLPVAAQAPLYMVLVGLHGISFGILIAPANSLFMGFGFEATVAWIIAGLPFDTVHAIGNIAAGTMIVPLAALLKKFGKT